MGAHMISWSVWKESKSNFGRLFESLNRKCDECTFKLKQNTVDCILLSNYALYEPEL